MKPGKRAPALYQEMVAKRRHLLEQRTAIDEALRQLDTTYSTLVNLDTSLGGESATKPVKNEGVPTPPTRKGLLRKTRVAQVGLTPIAAKILRAAFTAEKLPGSLKEAIALAGLNTVPRLAYDKETKSRHNVSIPVDDDLQAERSMIKGALAGALRTLLLFRKKRRHATTPLKNLVKEVTRRHKMGAVVKTIKKWGISPKET